MRILGYEIRKASTLAQPEQWVIDALAGTSTDSGVVVNEQTALRMSAVWSCIRVLSESVAMLPLILYRREGDKKTRATDHRLYSVLHDRPNPEMTAYTFRAMMMTQLCLRGNAYAEIQVDRLGRPIGLYPIPQEQFTVEVERNKEGKIIYKVTDMETGNEYILPDYMMFHLMGFSTNGLLGLSPIQFARQGIGLGMAAEQFGAALFGNGANMGGVLETPHSLSSEAQERLRKQWAERNSGLKNALKTVVLEQGMKYSRIGIPPEDAQFIETRKFQISDIARIFRVPPHMIGDLDRATWANIEHQSIEFVTHTLGPWLKNWEQTIAWKLLTPQEQVENYAEHLVDALLRGDTQSRYAAYATARQNGWMSVNDIRRLENMDPIEDGDVYLVPLNMVPAEQAGQGNTEPSSGGEPTATRYANIPKSFEPVFRDALLRIIKRERADILREARKRKADAESLRIWISHYYDSHVRYCVDVITPILDCCDDTEEGKARRAEEFGLRRSYKARDELLRTLESVEGDLPSAIERCFDKMLLAFNDDGYVLEALLL